MRDAVAAAQRAVLRTHLRSSVCWAFVCPIAGLTVNALLLWPDVQGGHAWLSYGRVRAVHTNVPLYGWFWPVFLATVLDSVPRWFGLALWRPALARVGLWMWNAVLAGGVVLLLTGHQQPREYAELPLGIDALLAATFYLPAVSLAVPMLRARARVGWLGGVVLGLLLCVPPLVLLGNPPFTDRFDAQALGYEGQNILGYCIGGFVIATTFLLLDPAARAAATSRRWVWGFAAVPLVAFCVGVAWDLTAGSVPYGAQIGILATSGGLMVPLAMLTWAVCRAAPDARFAPARLAFALGTLLYVLAGVEGCLQFAASMRSTVQFTAWMAGHAHLAMAGSMMLYVFGALYALLARTHDIAPRRWGVARVHVAAWCGSMLALAALLTWSGWREGTAIVREGMHELDAWTAQRQVWMGTLAIGAVATAVLAHHLLWVWRVRDSAAPLFQQDDPERIRLPGGRFSALMGAGTTIVFFVIVLVNLFGGATSGAVHPADSHGDRAQGKAVYIREGCVSCHTMQVRAVDDPLRFGPPSTLAEYQTDLPHQLGTRRIGPDLLRVGGKYSDAWHAEHLSNPRVLFPDSPMPAYAFLPPADRDALIAYLQSREPESPWPVAGGARRARNTPGWPLYEKACAPCHGLNGDGHGVLAKSNQFAARDFTSPRLMRSRRDQDLVRAIRRGIHGTSMPTWEDVLRDEDVTRLIETLRAFSEEETS